VTASPSRRNQIADYVWFVALRAASSGYAQIGLFWRGLLVPRWLVWPAGVPGRRTASGAAKATGPGVRLARMSVLREG